MTPVQCYFCLLGNFGRG